MNDTNANNKSPFRLLLASAFYEIKAYSPYLTSLMGKHIDPKITGTLKALDMAGIDWDFIEISGDSYVSRAKNSIVNDFLKSDFTHLFMIDSDLSWDVSGFLKVLKCAMEGAEMVGATYPNKNTWENYGVVPILENGKPIIKEITNIKVMQVHLLPGGFIIYSRKAFERAEPNLDRYVNPKNLEEFYQYFGQVVRKSPFSGGKDSYTNHLKKIFAQALNDYGEYLGPNPNDTFLECFRCNIEKNNTLIGEDYYFQYRFQEMGGAIWVVPDVEMGHYGVKEWRGNYWNFVEKEYKEYSEAPVPETEVTIDVTKLTVLINNFSEVIPDLSSHFNIATTIGDVDRLDAAIFWNDELPDQRAAIEALKTAGIPTFVMSHGAVCGADSIYDATVGEKENLKVIADYYLVWSDLVKDKVEAKGGQAITVGSPLQVPNEHMPDGKTVTYFPYHVNGCCDSLSVWNKLNSMAEISPVIKLLSGEHDVTAYSGRTVVSDRFVYPKLHNEMLNAALHNSSCMVTDVAGTEITMAAKLDIPIIKIKNQFPNRHPEFVKEVSLEDLPDAIRVALAHPEFNAIYRQQFAGTYYPEGNCADNIAAAIKKVIAER